MNHGPLPRTLNFNEISFLAGTHRLPSNTLRMMCFFCCFFFFFSRFIKGSSGSQVVGKQGLDVRSRVAGPLSSSLMP